MKDSYRFEFVQFSAEVAPSSLFPRVAQKSKSAESLLPLVAQKSPASAPLFILSSRSSSSSMLIKNVSSSGSRLLCSRLYCGMFHLKHLESSGPQTRNEFFFPTEKRSVGSLFSVSRCIRSPKRPFGLIDLLLKLPKSEFGFRELKPPLFPAGIALKREFGFIDDLFPIGLRRPGMELKREFGFIDRLPDKEPKSELGFSTFFFPRTAKNVGPSSGLARFKAI